jgi:O-antigen ligase
MESRAVDRASDLLATANAWAARGATVPAHGMRLDERRWADGVAVLAAGAAISMGILAGMALQSTPIIVGASLVAIVAAVAAPPLGLVILAFMAALQSPLLPAPGFNAFLVGAILLGWVYRLPIDRPRLSVGAPLFLLVAFILYVFVQQLPEMASGYLGPQAYLVASLFIQLMTVAGAALAGSVVLSGRDPYPFLAALLMSATFAAALAILAGAGALGHPLDRLISRPDEISRAVGPFGNPNYFGQYLASAIALGAAWFLARRSKRSAWLLVGSVLVTATAIALTMSRGGFIALFAALVALAFLRSRRLGAAAVVVGVLLTLLVYPAFVDWRLGTNTSGSGAIAAALARSDEGRLGGVLAGLPLFAASPIFGVGFGHYSFMAITLAGSPVPIAAHNWYLNVLGELGLVGIAVWALLLLAVAIRLRSSHPVARSIGVAVFATLVVGSLFLEQPTSFQTSALTVLVLTAVLVADWGPPTMEQAPGRAERATAAADGRRPRAVGAA